MALERMVLIPIPVTFAFTMSLAKRFQFWALVRHTYDVPRQSVSFMSLVRHNVLGKKTKIFVLPVVRRNYDVLGKVFPICP